MNTFMGLFGIASALLFGTSVGVMSMSPPEYDVARGTAIGASVSAIITFLLWILMTDERLPTKVLVGIATGIVALGVLPVSLDWISRIQARNFQLRIFVPERSIGAPCSSTNRSLFRVFNSLFCFLGNFSAST
jgi:hypothetical protein